MEGQNYQTKDMELVFCMGPSTQNLGIPHMSTPALCRGIHKDRELHLERLDREKIDPASARTGGSDQRGGVNRLLDLKMKMLL